MLWEMNSKYQQYCLLSVGSILFELSNGLWFTFTWLENPCSVGGDSSCLLCLVADKTSFGYFILD